MTERRTLFGSGINSTLVRVFMMQALAISIAAFLGVFFAAKIVEDVLVKEALDGEAEHYWALYSADANAPRPNTNNLKGYLMDKAVRDAMPPELVSLGSGYQRLTLSDGREPLVHVSENGDARLFLLFDEVQVSRLALLFGVAPLSIVLLIIYVLMFIGYRLSHSAVSPVLQLARRVERFDIRMGNLADLGFAEESGSADTEVAVLESALAQFVERLQAFIQRERNFTRNASHELRTPLAVLKGNLQILKEMVEAQPATESTVARMEKTVRDMESLLETLLLLAREDESKLSREPVVINDLLAERMDACAMLFGNEGVTHRLDAEGPLTVHAPEKVLTIIFNNLVRNAFEHTQKGSVTAIVAEGSVEIVDTGSGMPEDVLGQITVPFYRNPNNTVEGHGLGLSLVARLCNRFGWSFRASSTLGEGSRMTIEFS